MKTKEELNALKEEVETLNNKLKELTDKELKQVAGGRVHSERREPSTYGDSDGVEYSPTQSVLCIRLSK